MTAAVNLTPAQLAIVEQRAKALKLTPIMAQVLLRMYATGDPIEYRRGGWWTTRSTETVRKAIGGREYDVPVWFVARLTVRGLVTRGLIEEIDAGPGYARSCVLSPAGMAAAFELAPGED